MFSASFAAWVSDYVVYDPHGVLNAGARLVVLRVFPLLAGAHVEFLSRLLSFAPLLPLRRDAIHLLRVRPCRRS